jgi:hypothetical protein
MEDFWEKGFIRTIRAIQFKSLSSMLLLVTILSKLL